MAGSRTYTEIYAEQLGRLRSPIDAMTSELERTTDSMTITAGRIGRLSGASMFESSVFHSPNIMLSEYIMAQVVEKIMLAGIISAMIMVFVHEGTWRMAMYSSFLCVDIAIYVVNRLRRQKLDYERIFDGKPWDIDWYQQDPGRLKAPRYPHIHRVFHILRGGPKIPSDCEQTWRDKAGKRWHGIIYGNYRR